MVLLQEKITGNQMWWCWEPCPPLSLCSALKSLYWVFHHAVRGPRWQACRLSMCLCYIDTLPHVRMCEDGSCHTHTLGALGKSLSGQASLLGPGDWGNSAWLSAQDAILSPLPQQGPAQAVQAGWLAGRLLEGSHEHLWGNKEIAEKVDFGSSKCKAMHVHWTAFFW